MARKKVRTGPHRPTDLSSELAKYPAVWGIYVGDGCVTGESPLTWREIDAHAHNDVKDEWFGWICIASPWDVVTSTDRPTVLLKHEIAHILCANTSHGKDWRLVLTAMGAGREAKKYERQASDKREQSKISEVGT